MQVSHSTVVAVSREQAIHVATGPDSPLWIGSVRDIEVDGWPALGGTMAWTMGRNLRFVATITENALPDRLVMQVENPSGSGLVEHRFEEVEDGTRYTKTVTIPREGFWHRLAWLWLPSAVTREVRRFAQAASR